MSVSVSVSMSMTMMMTVSMTTLVVELYPGRTFEKNPTFVDTTSLVRVVVVVVVAKFVP